MTRVIVDDALRHKLANLSEFLELCDDSGRVLAHIVPLPDPEEYELTEPPMSEDELRRREASTDWYTTDEVIGHLRGLK